MLALLAENGPCRVADAADQHLGRTNKNPWSWTEAANVVWVDQPGGTGFSVGPVVSTESDVVRHVLAFMQSFYTHFPAFEEVPLFIFGESYAGHYIPAIALGLVQNSMYGGRLKGVGIGNGLVDPWPQLASKPDMAYTGGKGGSLGRGIISKETFKSMEDALKPCHKLVSMCQSSAAKASPCLLAFETCVMPQLFPVLSKGRNPYDLRKGCTRQPLCYNFDAEAQFLRDPEVQRSLGLEPVREWDICSYGLVLNFIASGDWLARFDNYVSELLGADIPVLIYNGDTDYMVDWIGSKRWVQELDWPYKEAWAAAPDLPFVVGNTSKGLERTAAGLTFIQLFNAGHMVPRDQPEASLSMFREFISPTSRWAPGVWRLSAESPMSWVSAVCVMILVFLVSLAAVAVRMAKCWRRRESRYPPLLVAS